MWYARHSKDEYKQTSCAVPQSSYLLPHPHPLSLQLQYSPRQLGDNFNYAMCHTFNTLWTITLIQLWYRHKVTIILLQAIILSESHHHTVPRYHIVTSHHHTVRRYHFVTNHSHTVTRYHIVTIHYHTVTRYHISQSPWQNATWRQLYVTVSIL